MKLCKIEHCENKSHAQGYCFSHYQYLLRKGELETRTQRLAERGRLEDHPFYRRWSKLKSNGSLCESWAQDFWQFVEDIGEKPEESTKLLKLDNDKPFGPDNYRWAFPLIGEQKNAYYREWYKNSPGQKNKRYFEAYGITLEDYQKLYDEQNGKCAICKKEEESIVRIGVNHDKRSLAVDHSHKNGKVRALLCASCNRGIAFMKEDVDILLSAIVYLKKHQTT